MLEIKAKKNKVQENKYDILVHYNGEEANYDLINIMVNAVVDVVDKMVAANQEVTKQKYYETFAGIFQMLADKEQ